MIAGNGFSKRFYTPAAFAAAFADIIRHLPDLRAARRSRRVDRGLAEKLMLVVTGVNGCRYCSYFHSRLALRIGMTSQEIEAALALDLEGVAEKEAVALAFAQHYAESGASPDAEARQRLVHHYGADTARDILSYLRMISMGNLAGNTVDAFLSRLRGRPAPGSSALAELPLFLLFAPVLLPLLPRLGLPAGR